MKQFNLEKNENILSKIGVSIHDNKGGTRNFKDVLNDILKVYYKLDNSKENDILKDYIAQELVGFQNKNEFINLINNKGENEMNTMQNLQQVNEELVYRNKELQDKNTYLETQLEKCKSRHFNETVDNANYKEEYKQMQEQLNKAIKIIKYLSSLL